ncbi:hypothetical protein Hanom_Chr16g01452311 [Helianthus anomalus]
MSHNLIVTNSHTPLDVDPEGDTQEENIVWVDARADETWVKYEGFLVDKYGKERNKHPKFDKDL